MRCSLDVSNSVRSTSCILSLPPGERWQEKGKRAWKCEGEIHVLPNLLLERRESHGGQTGALPGNASNASSDPVSWASSPSLFVYSVPYIPVLDLLEQDSYWH